MPWKEMDAVDRRKMFIEEWLKDKETVEELCEVYGISRKTGYKWIERHHEGGIANLMDRSRRSHRLVREIGEETAEAVVELRKRYPTWGPKKFMREGAGGRVACGEHDRSVVEETRIDRRATAAAAKAEFMAAVDSGDGCESGVWSD